MKGIREMAGESLIKVKGVNQVCIVVKNLEEVMRNYWNILGIGPWEVYAWEAPLIYDRTYHGKPAWAREKIAVTQLGKVQLKLCQPIDGDSIYHDYVIENGEGLHHLNFLVDDVDETTEILTKEGFPSLQSGRWESREEAGAYNYIDIKPTKAIWKPVHGKIVDAEHSRYPRRAQVSPAKVNVKAIAQVGIVVKNLEEVMRNYWNILGIGPWDILEAVPPTLHHRTYRGKPRDFTLRFAFTMVGPVQLGLVQPVSGDSSYSDFIMKHGEGLCYIQFIADDIKETTEMMNKEGFNTLTSAGLSDGGRAWYDTEDTLKCVWQAFQMPKTMPTTTLYPKLVNAP